MTTPRPDNPPLIDGVCAAWAQFHELPADIQPLHTEEVWCSILALASDILWSATGGRWRNVEASETVTLDPQRCGCDTAVRRWVVLVAGDPARVRLPRPDVTAIMAVEIAGESFADFRQAGNYAVRTDGLGWPLAASTQITYAFGLLVPHSGRLMAILLATELGKALAGKACSLPARVTSVTRQGVSYDMLESLEVLRDGRIGIYAVDQWVTAVTQGRRSIGRVWSPDIVEARRA